MKEEKKLDYPVLASIARRWSPRAFSEKKVPLSELKSIFEAGRWAASARNQQPWAFIWASKSDDELYQTLLSCMVPWNQSWAKTADVLVICFARTVSGEKNHPNDTALYDLGLALGNMTTQAMENGIYIHHMGGIEKEVIQHHFNPPAFWQPVTMLALGYPGNLELIPSDIAANEYAEQVRKPQDEFVFNRTPEWK
jgi:nitroreductase